MTSDEVELEPTGRLRVDITPHKREPGTQRPFVLAVEPLDGVELPSVEVVGGRIDVDLQLEIVGEQLSASGLLTIAWTGPCRRCLDEVEGAETVKILEIFEKAPVEGETYPLEKDFVDLRPMVREALVLLLPIAPLCGEDCEGPAPELFSTDGVEAAIDDADEAEPAIDPRWAALGDLTFDDG